MLDGDRNISMWYIYIYYSERLILKKKEKRKDTYSIIYLYSA